MIASVIKCDVCGHTISSDASIDGWYAITDNYSNNYLSVFKLASQQLTSYFDGKHVCSVSCVAKIVDAKFNPANKKANDAA